MFKALFMFKVIWSRSKVTHRSNHDFAQLDHDRNICAKFELPPAYSHRDLAWTKFSVIFRIIFMFKVTRSRSKFEPGSDHDVAQLDHGRNMCAKFELSPAYSHRDLARTKLQPPPAHPPARPPS